MEDVSETLTKIRSISSNLKMMFRGSDVQIGYALDQVKASFENVKELAPFISANERDVITKAVAHLFDLRKRFPFIGQQLSTLAGNVGRKASQIERQVPKLETKNKGPRTLKTILRLTKSMLSGSQRTLLDICLLYTSPSPRD